MPGGERSGSADSAAAEPLRRALDGVLGRAGFEWNVAVARGELPDVLYEALPADAVRLVPTVAPQLGDLEGPCLDLWMTYDPRSHVVVTATLEGRPLTAVARELGQHDAAVAVERSADAGAPVAAVAALLKALFRENERPEARERGL